MIGRFIALWLALILLASGFYFFLSRRGSESGALIVVAIALAIVTVVVVVIRSRVGVQYNNTGVALLSQGRYAAALEAFEKALPHLQRSALILMNVGVANQHLWRLEAAEKSLVAASKRLGSKQLHLLLFPHLALTYALGGKLAETREALQRCQALHTDASPHAVLARAVVLCREDKWSDAAGVLSKHEVRSLAGMQRGLAEALQAWCGAHGFGEARQVVLADVYGETGPEAIKPHWPELVSFLESLPGGSVRDRARLA